MTTKAGTEQPPRDVLPLEPASRKKAGKPRGVLPPLERSSIVAPRRRWYVRCKASAERTLALVLLVLAAPLILLAGLLVKLTSRGPVFYTQTRLGRDGQPFTIYKIRTMVHDCESLTGPRWAIPGDPRVIRVGHFLRRSHLDELPQLLNVLCGHMGLIGPRPERPEFLPDLECALPGYRTRLALRPGVTGLAQVLLDPDTDLDSVRRKLAYDLYYVEHVNPWLDLRILLATAFKAVGDPGRISRKFRLVQSGEAIESTVVPAVPHNTVVRPKKCA